MSSSGLPRRDRSWQRRRGDDRRSVGPRASDPQSVAPRRERGYSWLNLSLLFELIPELKDGSRIGGEPQQFLRFEEIHGMESGELQGHGDRLGVLKARARARE